MNNLPIIYRDDELIAINKPSGLLVHRSLIDKHETRFAMQMLRDQIGRRVYPVHRLDKPTSGVLVFALTSDLARNISAQFTAGSVKKHYLAVVRGYTEELGLIDYPLKEQLDRIADAKADKNKDKQPAITSYRRLATCELPIAVGRYQSARYSLISLQAKTGRKHQLRRHMKHIFHPIVGDTTHGDGKHNQLFRREFSSKRLLLHCEQMRLNQPSTQQPILLHADLPENFQETLQQLGLIRDDLTE